MRFKNGYKKIGHALILEISTHISLQLHPEKHLQLTNLRLSLKWTVLLFISKLHMPATSHEQLESFWSLFFSYHCCKVNFQMNQWNYMMYCLIAIYSHKDNSRNPYPWALQRAVANFWWRTGRRLRKAKLKVMQKIFK